MSDDKSGYPLWNPSVIDGGGEKPKEEKVVKEGTRPAWHYKDKELNAGEQTEFDICYGDKPVKFKVIGNKSDAVAVVSGLRLSERVSRNAMRMAIVAMVKGGDLNIENEPSFSAFNEQEEKKMYSFLSWMTSVGMAMLVSGLRPWNGKAGKNDDEAPAATPLSIVKPSKEVLDDGSDSDLN